MIEWSTLILESVVLLPFFGWGVYTLYVRLQKHEECSLLFEALTLLFVVLFIAWQAHYLRTRGAHRAEYLLAMLGIYVATLALYGHLAVSLATRLLLDLIDPRREGSADEPRFGAAESHERVGDYEKALAEYEMLAKIHPHHVTVHARAADTLLLLHRPREAIAAFEMALKRATLPEQALALAMRLSDIYAHELDDPGAARKGLEGVAARFPDSRQAVAARRRMERLELVGEGLPRVALETLTAHPVEEPADETEELASEPVLDLETLSSNPLSVEEEPADSDVLEGKKKEPATAPEIGEDLLALEEAPLEEEAEDAAPARGGLQSLGVEPLDAVTWEEETSEEEDD